ncbi:hypothetical protein FRC07_015011 [Ceratobasidium sp. 392]|nr:hypothetical protein FRC07_015011 [Ceratobasidium sp. 392]
MAETRTDSSSPIDILPDSLLSDIFVLTCCYQNNPVMWTHTGDGRRLDCCYVLSWVSHRWRAIALSTSRVWCFVVAPRQTEYLAAQLARSGDAPIDVLFDLIYLSKSDILKDIQESLNLLAEKSHWTRIRDLEVELSEDFPNLSNLVVEGISKVVDASPLVNFRDISVRFTDNPGDDNLEVPELDDALPDQDWDVDWRSLCRYNTLEEVHIGGFSSEFLTGLLLQTERLSKLREFSLGPDNVRSPTEFVEQLAQKLVDTPCCPTLHSLTIQISPNARGAELIDELRLKRPLLDIYVEP